MSQRPFFVPLSQSPPVSFNLSQRAGLEAAPKLLAAPFQQSIVITIRCVTIEILTNLLVNRFPVFDLGSNW